MISSELIKQIQEADPTGKLHVRLRGGGIPTFVERLPGYYDGACEYIEEDKIIRTKKDDKIDIYTTDTSDYVWEYEGDMEEIKKHIIVDYKDEYFWENIEKEAKKAREFHEKSMNEFIVRVIKKMQEGFLVVQPIDKKVGLYNCMSYYKDKKHEQLCQGECGAVLKSGFFKDIATCYPDDEAALVIRWTLK